MGLFLGIAALFGAMVVLPVGFILKLLLVALVSAAAVRWAASWVSGSVVGWAASLAAALAAVGVLALMLLSLVMLGFSGQGQHPAISVWLPSALFSFVLAFRLRLGLGWFASLLVAVISVALAGVGLALISKLG